MHDHKLINRWGVAFLAVALFLLGIASDSAAGIGDITTVAGGHVGDGLLATEARLNRPYRAAVGSNGDIYIADEQGFRVRKVDAQTGIITTVAGSGLRGNAEDGQVATEAHINRPMDVAVDASGDVYFIDRSNRVFRVDSSTGILSVFAGGGEDWGDEVPATTASFGPGRIFLGPEGDLYIADPWSDRVRKVDATTGTITTVAGGGEAFGDGEQGRYGAQLGDPEAVAVDPQGNLYIADYRNFRVRKVDAETGIINTVAGTGERGYSGDGGAATEAMLNYPYGLAVDASGDLYIASRYARRVRRVEAETGVITTVVGGGSNHADGVLADEAALAFPVDVDFDADGNLYVVQQGSQRVSKVDAQTGRISTVAGRHFGNDGPATDASLYEPYGVTVDADGNVYAVEWTGYHVRKIDTSGQISALIGNGLPVYSGDGGQASDAAITNSMAVAVDALGQVYISGGGRVRRIDVNGIVTTVAGGGNSEEDGVLAINSKLNGSIFGMCLDSAGNLFLGEYGAHRVRKVDAQTGIISTVAGTGSSGFEGDGGPATDAKLNRPWGLSVNAAGDLFIAEYSNNRIRRVDGATGLISTVAGNGERGYNEDGIPALEASLRDPTHAFEDADGNLFVADRGNSRIRTVDGTGTISTVAGGQYGFNGDTGPATEVALMAPSFVWVDVNGDFFFSDHTNGRIRKVEGIAAATPVNVGVYSGPTSPALSSTATGAEVSLELTDASTGEAPVSLSFSNVVAPGVTSMASQESGPPPPQGFQVGDAPVYFDISTTATFSGAVELCYDYSGDGITDDADLKLFHFENEEWTDVTTSHDAVNDVICGQVSSFSPFALFEVKPPAVAASEKHRVVVVATVTLEGQPVAGVELALSRSISGREADYAWSGTTDADGQVEIEVIAEGEAFWRRGASGMYLAKATNASGTVVGTWTSIPITGGTRSTVLFPLGGRAEVLDKEALDTSGSFGLAGNHPNPFNPQTQIAYQLPEAGEVSLVVYNSLGQAIRTLVRGPQAAGHYRVTWSGQDDFGRSVASGIYFYRLVADQGRYTAVKKMLLLK